MATSDKSRLGEIHTTIEGYKIKIIRYLSSLSCDIEFLKDARIKYNVQYCQIIGGNIKNPYHPSVCNIGYIGEGKHKVSVNKKATKEYKTWRGMLERCYDKKWHLKYPTYKDCIVIEEWHNFQNFAQWFEENYKEGYQLDKDILQKRNKIYSPETCCFVPQEVNTLFIKSNSTRGLYPIGVYKQHKKFKAVKINNTNLGIFNTPKEAFEAYKQAKELYIKKLAVSYYTLGKISVEVYNAMFNYQVEIDD